MPEPLRQFLYVSQSFHQLTTDDCEKILTVSRENNERDGITGFLAYLQNGTIIQILEGVPEIITRTYDRISKDFRHHSVTRIIDIECDERLFAEWSMGFRMLEEQEMSALPNFVNLRDGEVPELLDGATATIKVFKSIIAVNRAKD